MNWNPSWNPDPRFPQHIVDLAAACVFGDITAKPALHDALVEEGLHKCADLFLNYPYRGGVFEDGPHEGLYTKSTFLGIFVGDGYMDWMEDGSGNFYIREILDYLAKRGLPKTT